MEGCGDKTVHYWKLTAEFTLARLVKFADEVKTVTGKEYNAKQLN